MSKIAIVGVEGSGKTVLLAALSECYQKNSETEPYLMPENQSAFVFMQQVPHKLRVEREWPAATGMSGLKSLKWTLRLGKDVLREIEMLDYPGELYRLAFGERSQTEVAAHRSELDEFLSHLTDAETLVVLFNLADLQDLGTNTRNAEAVWITRGIFDFAKKLPNLKRRLLVFTQADRYAADLEAAGGAQGLYAKAKALTVINTDHPDLPVIAMAAVDGTDADGRPREGYSSVACHELMRELLYETDALARTFLQYCTENWAALQAFSVGSIDAYEQLLLEYKESVIALVHASKPLMHFYRHSLKGHQEQSSFWSVFMADAKEVAIGTNASTLAEAQTWAPLLEQYDSAPYAASVVKAICTHYKDGLVKWRDSATLQILTIQFAWCPPGEFMMGSPEDEKDRSNDETQHRVILTRGFWLGIFPVTQRQWESVMGTNPSHFKKGKTLGLFGGKTQPDHPVEMISWLDCQKFVACLNDGVPGANLRLPTEAEWEYACRSEKFEPYAGDLHTMAWYVANSGGTTNPVGQKQPNAWGLYDMHGNVCEWCQDWYGAYPSGSVTNPTGRSSGWGRVYRGGSWVDDACFCRSAYRRELAPGVGGKFKFLGLRLARDAP